MSARYRLTALADEDIVGILTESGRRFGPIQREAYARILEKAVGMIAETPERPGSRLRAELGPGVRSFHMELAAGRRGAASHAIYYAHAEEGIIVLRVLHERMDPDIHLARKDIPDD